jgi:hypothetical protein
MNMKILHEARIFNDVLPIVSLLMSLCVKHWLDFKFTYSVMRLSLFFSPLIFPYPIVSQTTSQLHNKLYSLERYL